MKQLKSLTILGVTLSLCALSAESSDRQTRYFELDDAAGAGGAPAHYVMMMTSSDLHRYPKSVVTFDIRERAGRAPSSIAPAETPDAVVANPHVRRHYRRLEDGQFGRPGEPQVVFNEEAHTVFIGFVGKEGKTFKFKEVDRPTLSDTAERIGKADAH